MVCGGDGGGGSVETEMRSSSTYWDSLKIDVNGGGEGGICCIGCLSIGFVMCLSRCVYVLWG